MGPDPKDAVLVEQASGLGGSEGLPGTDGEDEVLKSQVAPGPEQ